MEDKYESNHDGPKSKKFNGRNVADNIIKGVIVLIMAVIFVMIADQVITTPFISAEIEGEFFHGSIFGTTIITIVAYIVGIIVGALVGYGISPFVLRLIWAAIHRIESGLNDFESQDIIVGTLGLLFGLIIANLIGLAFARLPIIGAYGPIVFSIVFGYAGMSIDGRIAEICSTGFLEGPLLVPVFVLEELQLIADSSDLLKRNKGRRGLDILKQMQEDNYVEVRIINDDFDDVQGVDSKLVRLGRKINAKVVTNDYNLNKVAALQGVAVLNINDLANALKPARIPGEHMNVLIVKAGKEENQGVAYLDDGTMIVVEDGQKYIGSTVPVTVTSVLQTSAGRMIFVKIANE